MKCFNCGGTYRPGARVCPNCGVSFEDYYVDSDAVRVGDSSKGKKSNKNGVLIAVICAFIAVIVAAIIVIFVLLSGGSKKEPETKYICALCDNEVEKDQQYCKECEKSKFCKICEKSIKEGTKFCDKCKEKHSCKSCGVVKDYIEKYCVSCEEKLPECKLCKKNFEGNEKYCDDCITEYNVENISCFGCHRPMGDESNYYIAKRSELVFCSQCDSGDYCASCDNPIADGNSDGTNCFSCKVYDCFSCGKPVTGKTAICLTDDGYAFCADCETGYQCNRCMAPIESGEKCAACGYYEAETFDCLGCDRTLRMDKATYSADDGYYCYDCDTGIYCNRCPVPVDEPGLCDYCYDAMN